MGCLSDLLRDSGYIDLGISVNAKVEECRKHRRRHHRFPILNTIEEEIERYKANLTDEVDISLWMNGKGVYKKAFSSKETWQVIISKNQNCYWYKMVWFKHATPRFSFVLWMAMHEKLSTGERMSKWGSNVDTACMLCRDPYETLSHLFFDCLYSSQI